MYWSVWPSNQIIKNNMLQYHPQRLSTSSTDLQQNLPWQQQKVARRRVKMRLSALPQSAALTHTNSAYHGGKHAETFLWIDLREEDSDEIFSIISSKEKQKTLGALRKWPTCKTNRNQSLCQSSSKTPNRIHHSLLEYSIFPALALQAYLCVYLQSEYILESCFKKANIGNYWKLLRLAIKVKSKK